MQSKIDTVIIFRTLKKLTTEWKNTEAFKAGVINESGNVLVRTDERTALQRGAMSLFDRVVFNLKRTIPEQGNAYLSALALVKEYVQERTNEQTANVLVEKLEEHKLIPISKQYDLTTVEGFMDAFEDEMVREMFSGAAIGGAFDGAQSNSAANSTGMAAPNGPSKKKKKKGIDKILHTRL